MYAGTSVRTSVWILAYVHVCGYVDTSVHMCMQVLVYVHVCGLPYVRVCISRVQILAYVCVCRYWGTYMCADTSVCMCVRILP